jgi:hypothetical protein
MIEILVFIVVAPIIFALFYLSGPVQARSRGYSFWFWFTAGCLSNPFLCAISLALLPNRARLRLREKLEQDLNVKLPQPQKAPQAPSVKMVPPDSIGELPTE